MKFYWLDFLNSFTPTKSNSISRHSSNVSRNNFFTCKHKNVSLLNVSLQYILYEYIIRSEQC